MDEVAVLSVVLRLGSERRSTIRTWSENRKGFDDGWSHRLLDLQSQRGGRCRGHSLGRVVPRPYRVQQLDGLDANGLTAEERGLGAAVY